MAQTFASLTNSMVAIEKLYEVGEYQLIQPMRKGKWSVREVVGHLESWDTHILSEWVPAIEEGARLSAFPDHDTFNHEAIEMRKNLDVKTSLDQFLTTRKKLISQLLAIDPNVRFTIGDGKRQFSVETFAKMFAKHDQHHMKQIEEFLSNE
ncbi:DinB family protein [Geomicrobium sp. JCM 19039]|uniref:DinB family protein n=1 Tax=Geomicrobium sp. JCM 19039 TaxID=1460636 RepID=UPI00045F44AA|nr:DinB family protein [Geomicrobium sp. JCM 19039]GAK13172.1 hypothetical protein JCM19039_2996 [Geomicrobium sp. JCM 19039]